MSARRDTMNCCLFDVGAVLRGGFEMGNLWYNEPKTLNVAFDVIGDIVLSARLASSTAASRFPSVDQHAGYHTPKPVLRECFMTSIPFAGPV